MANHLHFFASTTKPILTRCGMVEASPNQPTRSNILRRGRKVCLLKSPRDEPFQGYYNLYLDLKPRVVAALQLWARISERLRRYSNCITPGKGRTGTADYSPGALPQKSVISFGRCQYHLR